MSHAYTEDQLIEQPAIGLFAEPGWQGGRATPNAGVTGESRDAGSLGRETKGEVVLASRLRMALAKLNPALPPEAITAAMDELTRNRAALSLAAANREVYLLLKEGIKVSVTDTDSTPHPSPPHEPRFKRDTAGVVYFIHSQLVVTTALILTFSPGEKGQRLQASLYAVVRRANPVACALGFMASMREFFRGILSPVEAERVRAGLAMVVSIDKATALKMHDKVRAHWEAETRRVRLEFAKAGLTEDKKQELQARLDLLESTDMALILSPAQNEIEQMNKHGLDIVPHRKRMNESQPPLDEKFKDTEDPLRIVFLCAMWLTGFEAPSVSTVYLDKPMRNHTLMQTIARANRVFPGKHSGMIVDYANVFASLEKALSIYGPGGGGGGPVKDKAKLVADLRRAVEAATNFCATRQVILPAIAARVCLSGTTLGLGCAVGHATDHQRQERNA